MTRLPTDGVRKALVTGGDPAGRYHVGRVYPTGAEFDQSVVVWRDGRLVGTVRIPGSDQRLDDVNRTGLAVGSSYAPRIRPYAHQIGGRTVVLEGGDGYAAAVNDAGTIAGGLGPDEYQATPVRWAAPTAAPEPLGVPDGTTGVRVLDIDEDGTVLGTVARSVSTAHDPTGYLWQPDGTGSFLPLPVVDGRRAAYFWPEAIRNGWVVGRAGIEDGRAVRFTAFRYRVETRRYERLPERAGLPVRVAANGWMLGTAATPTLTAGSRTVPLPTLRGARREYQPTAYSDDGLVAAGYSIGPETQNEPLLWRCGLSR